MSAPVHLEWTLDAALSERDMQALRDWGAALVAAERERCSALAQPVEQRQPLTDEQITALHRKMDPDCHISFTFRIARAIERAHGVVEDKP